MRAQPTPVLTCPEGPEHKTLAEEPTPKTKRLRSPLKRPPRPLLVKGAEGLPRSIITKRNQQGAIVRQRELPRKAEVAWF